MLFDMRGEGINAREPKRAPSHFCTRHLSLSLSATLEHQFERLPRAPHGPDTHGRLWAFHRPELCPARPHTIVARPKDLVAACVLNAKACASRVGAQERRAPNGGRALVQPRGPVEWPPSAAHFQPRQGAPTRVHDDHHDWSETHSNSWRVGGTSLAGVEKAETGRILATVGRIPAGLSRTLVCGATGTGATTPTARLRCFGSSLKHMFRPRACERARRVHHQHFLDTSEGPKEHDRGEERPQAVHAHHSAVIADGAQPACARPRPKTQMRFRTKSLLWTRFQPIDDISDEFDHVLLDERIGSGERRVSAMRAVMRMCQGPLWDPISPTHRIWATTIALAKCSRNRGQTLSEPGRIFSLPSLHLARLVI